MEEAVSNTTALILLSKINKLDLLKKKYQTVFIPSIVLEELTSSQKYIINTQYITREINTFLIVSNPQEILTSNLGAGENTALSLALEKKMCFLTDDKKARTYARLHNIPVLGTLGIIFWNVQQKYITKKQGKEYIEQLVQQGYYLSPELYLKIIQELS
ncbi:DUF3368 domain-containing protein [Candidatus Woesearchaeota archaeon]|nr:DUF3368 domain-containing protein [Candidatus Woesearchaeota archaeon]